MYFTILKKDLKRKKTMNLILLIFITMASLFVSSSVNNLISIVNATEHYFDQAGLQDYFIAAGENETGEKSNEKAITQFIEKSSYVEDWTVDKNQMLQKENLELETEEGIIMSNTAMLSPLGIRQQKFFDCEDREIKKMEDGEIYLPIKLMEENGLKAGDAIYLVQGEKRMEFSVAGNLKDALMGSPMMGMYRIIISDADYAKVEREMEYPKGVLYSVKTDNLEKFEEEFNQTSLSIQFGGDRTLIQTTYIMDMVTAGLLLVVSICLILIALVILRFTIVFTLDEEFREIGVMKAIGIGERKIRGLYMVKYLMISLLGALTGFVLGIPFGAMFLEQVSKNMVMKGLGGGWILNLVWSLLVIAVVLLFCYRCTGKVRRFSPIDAIRGGNQGERFHRKGILKLEKWHGTPVSFLSVNDIISGFRSFSVLLLIFLLGMLLIMIPLNTINTLKSDQLVNWFGMAQSDVYLTDEGKDNNIIWNEGRDYLKEDLEKMEQVLSEHGIDAKASVEVIYRFQVSKGSKSYKSLSMQGTGIGTKQYMYEEGEAPDYADEVALTYVTADHIDAGIGDTVKITQGGKEKEYVVTALYQSMNNMGEGIRFSEKEELDSKEELPTGTFARQLFYQDHPDKEECQQRMEKIKELFSDYEVSTGGEYIGKMMGNISEPLDAVKQLIVAVIMAINLLVAVLVSKTFITREQGEIGMLKAVGFSDSALMRWQVLRIGIVLVLAVVSGALLANPIAQISSGKIFEMMGASHIEFVVKPLEVYVMYPLLVLAATLGGAILAARQVRRISAQETNNIE